jgi:hypothetical protein
MPSRSGTGQRRPILTRSPVGPVADQAGWDIREITFNAMLVRGAVAGCSTRTGRMGSHRRWTYRVCLLESGRLDPPVADEFDGSVLTELDRRLCHTWPPRWA